MNKQMLIGHVGRDAEIRYTQSGQAVASFSVATSEKWKDKDGERKEKTTWHNITAWGKLAEICGEYVTKGRQVFVEGRTEHEEYEKDGQKRRATKVVASTVQLLGDRGERKADAGESSGRNDEPDLGTSAGDDIPF